MKESGVTGVGQALMPMQEGCIDGLGDCVSLRQRLEQFDHRFQVLDEQVSRLELALGLSHPAALSEVEVMSGHLLAMSEVLVERSELLSERLANCLDLLG